MASQCGAESASTNARIRSAMLVWSESARTGMLDSHDFHGKLDNP